ncbi:ribosome maturation factor RimM [Rhodobium gokarnense]|uniref:Ribosome maturation factor RimM n=1 Tax=Rhodobium gokarnense TaxID=364296 RepID=A0ABT3HDZ3_9HYPH|nr:ribosome maturation factor RimM [Rhodobium gokarnense]MCW2308608.1 16S rRNA processing protein RimM [Rhodobium gokarnense]
MADPDRILLGQIGAAHGIRGEVRLKSFTEPPEAIADYGALSAGNGREFEIIDWRASKGVLIVRLNGVKDRNAAEALNGTELFVSRDQLGAPEEDEFFHADLIGLDAVDVDGMPFGKVIAVHDFGAGDLLEIKPADRPSAYLPFTLEAVPEVDIAAGRIVVAPPPGLFDDGTDKDEDAAERSPGAGS